MPASSLTGEMLDDFLHRRKIVNVRCSDHAGVRLYQRLGVPLVEAKAHAIAAVYDALRSGRWSHEQPEWSVSDSYAPRQTTEWERWAWDADERCAYALAFRRSSWTVKTCIPRAQPSCA